MDRESVCIHTEFLNVTRRAANYPSKQSIAQNRHQLLGISPTKIIGDFTLDELIREVVDRPEFVGVVVHVKRDSSGAQPKAGDKGALALGQGMNERDAAMLLRNILKKIDPN